MRVKTCHLKALQRRLHEVNPYASYFKHAVDLMKEQGGIDIKKVIRADGGPDPRRSNLLTGILVSLIAEEEAMPLH